MVGRGGVGRQLFSLPSPSGSVRAPSQGEGTGWEQHGSLRRKSTDLLLRKLSISAGQISFWQEV
jgi:hypothetical protein